MGNKRIGQARVNKLTSENSNGLQTRVNKHINHPAAGAALFLTEADSGKTIVGTGAWGKIWLPRAKAGLNFRIMIKVVSNSVHHIQALSGDCIFGVRHAYDTDTDGEEDAHRTVLHATAIAAPTTYDMVTIDNNDGTHGGTVGDILYFEAVDGIAWFANMETGMTSTPATLVVVQ